VVTGLGVHCLEDTPRTRSRCCDGSLMLTVMGALLWSLCRVAGFDYRQSYLEKDLEGDVDWGGVRDVNLHDCFADGVLRSVISRWRAWCRSGDRRQEELCYSQLHMRRDLIFHVIAFVKDTRVCWQVRVSFSMRARG
jgi:hypothetical protein